VSRKVRTSFFEKRHPAQESKKFLLTAGACGGSAVNRHLWWRLTALPPQAPAVNKSFCALFSKSASYFLLGLSS
jgi:hypothetical protein